MHARILLLGALTLLTLVGAACSSGGEAEKAPADAQILTVTFGDSLSFDPPTLAVQAGRPVVLTVRNVGATDHDFFLTGMPARDIRNGGEVSHGHAAGDAIVGHPKARSQVTIRFTPTATGTYEFWCSVAGHRDAGMKGAITVT